MAFELPHFGRWRYSTCSLLGGLAPDTEARPRRDEGVAHHGANSEGQNDDGHQGLGGIREEEQYGPWGSTLADGRGGDGAETSPHAAMIVAFCLSVRRSISAEARVGFRPHGTMA